MKRRFLGSSKKEPADSRTIRNVHANTVHFDSVHPVKNDTIFGETEKIEVLILKVGENEILRDKEEMNDFDLNQDERCHFLYMNQK
ncbi:hypothetical protein DY000_02052912 [Brassica cretica]|uniref:Uncharacterized protein n=1 Tax=Brassica cretica TaxID=69181 RepID=A0ABQ7AI21_BRACR|nr:hypothetical protein DY000_02052912 [Brassica cretica]